MGADRQGVTGSKGETMASSATSSRLQEFDVLKGIAIFLVVIGHLADLGTVEFRLFRCVFSFVYAFHMPLFVFLAGLFDGPGKRPLSERIPAYLALYVALQIAFLGYNWLAGKPMGFSLLWVGPLPWFMLAMPQWMAIAHYSRNAHPVLVLALSVGLSLCAGYDPDINHYFSFSRVVVWAPFYLAGYRTSPRRLLGFCKEGKGRFLAVPALLFLLAFAAVCVLRTDDVYAHREAFVGRFPYSDVRIEGYGASDRLGYYLLSSLLVASVVLAFVHLPSRFLAWAGRRTLPIYCFHDLLVFALGDFGVYALLVGIPYGGVVLLLLSVPLVALCASPPFERLVSWFRQQFVPPETGRRGGGGAPAGLPFDS